MSDEPYIPPYVRAAMEKAQVSVELVEELIATVEVTSTCPKCGEEVDDPSGLGILHHAACGYCAHPSLDKGYCTTCGLLIAVEQTVLAIPGPDRESGYGV